MSIETIVFSDVSPWVMLPMLPVVSIFDRFLSCIIACDFQEHRKAKEHRNTKKHRNAKEHRNDKEHRNAKEHSVSDEEVSSNADPRVQRQNSQILLSAVA